MTTPHPQFLQFYGSLAPAAGLLTTWNGLVFRSSLPRYVSEPYRFTGTGSALAGGRWNVKGLMPAVYFSTTAETVAAEADAKANRYGWTVGSMRPQTRIGVQLQLTAVFDLTTPANLAAFGLQPADLTDCDWQVEQAADREALTQALARAVFERSGEGLVVPSARQPGGINVIVYPSNLLPDSEMATIEPESIPFVHGLP
jgi:RES domain-containing protein